MIDSLSDVDLVRLGVNSIGHRHKLRQMVKTKVEENRATDVDTSSNNTGRPRGLAQTVLNERSVLFNVGRKRANGKSTGGYYTGKKPKLKAGFTLHFLCLASKSQTVVPNSSEKEVLNNAGLGRKKIRFDKCDSQKDVCKRIMSDELLDGNETEGFPQLEKAGGFELLRSVQNCRELKLIDCTWSAKELQKNVNQQSTIYIRPIQNNLPTKPKICVGGNASHDDQGTEEYKTICTSCGQDFTMRQLREHLDLCEVEKNTVQINSQQPEQNVSETVIYIFDESTNYEHDEVNNNNSDVPADMASVETIDIDAQREVVHVLQGNESNIDIALKVANFCKEKNVMDPIEILKKFQQEMVTGRNLEISNPAEMIEGDVNFILIDRESVLRTGFDEISSIDPKELRKTLDVQFYNETAVDFGGPRKEFFRLILAAIKEKYFDNGLRELLFADYEMVGKIFALSILQNGKIPTFMGPDVLMEVFDGSSESKGLCIKYLCRGLDALGLYSLCKELPSFVHLFQNTHVTLTYKRVTNMLTPEFTEEGSNGYMYEKAVYAAFLRYLREVASGRRNSITLAKVLQFVTGADEEPVLGFRLHPSILFHATDSVFIPTANTCINCLRLPRPTHQQGLPEDSVLFESYDYAFTNTYYGLK
ncbi:hypothetical protein FSP39_005363 [Pinctada imbricata]|uniref:HECT-type E3 ubiquitin transferase n=1 Tax=Pinctada imbricata TaxID=66713 RepID=A0AA89BSA9_PINIB|nr:hypothetical protein FSP39_005363 [Pinctada imbricata]